MYIYRCCRFFSFFLCCFFILSTVNRWIKDYQKWWKTKLKAVEVWFLLKMLRISRTEKKSTDEEAELQRTLMKRIRQRQLAFPGHVLRRQGLEILVVTGRIEGRRARGVRDWSVWIVCVHRGRITWAQHSSSGLQRTECSSIARSPESSTMVRHHCQQYTRMFQGLKRSYYLCGQTIEQIARFSSFTRARF